MDTSMTESQVLLNAQLGFLDTHLALIHIPLEVYPFFVQPILRLLLHNDRVDIDGQLNTPQRPWMFWHPFVNISITPSECSVVCPREQAEKLFMPVVDKIPPLLRKSVAVSKEDYSVIMIGGEGLEAGKRVLDLTSPLALAGIPIFFITSYYCDFILVPLSSRSRVISALEERGFVFEADAVGEAGHMMNPASPLVSTRARKDSIGSFDFPLAVGTPPPATVPELQTRTFKLLRRNGISPKADPNIELVTCAGIKDSTASTSAVNFSQGKLQLGISKCLTTDPPPKFLSVTLTDSESASLTLEKTLVSHFFNDGEDLLLGKDGPEQVPITLDLKDLPLESTGIVCGVASRLTDGMKGRIGDIFNMSYLSTAKAGHVIVYMDELEEAMDALGQAEQNGFGEH
ncbi:hypothetical protein LTR37_005864 [Vermiconidia calcicola]|uniref:Uncharacterized protein n=1 Tax=Vermiconidia calcicola TaxID=1690605 RepID=A0ACC3NIH2_9PEZI|nr:hypothetical protein LTR37_005864 [Vermiconidia calcicola]